MQYKGVAQNPPLLFSYASNPIFENGATITLTSPPLHVALAPQESR